MGRSARGPRRRDGEARDAAAVDRGERRDEHVRAPVRRDRPRDVRSEHPHRGRLLVERGVALQRDRDRPARAVEARVGHARARPRVRRMQPLDECRLPQRALDLVQEDVARAVLRDDVPDELGGPVREHERYVGRAVQDAGAAVERHLRRGEPALHRRARVEDGADALVEELVLPDREARAVAGPQRADLAAARHRLVDPLAVLLVHPLGERARCRVLHPRRDRSRDRQEEREHDERKHDREAPRHEQERERREDRARDDHGNDLVELDPALVHAPEREHQQRVRLARHADQPRVWDHRRERRCEDRRRACRERRPRRSLVDPDEQRDQHQRREVEEVALLDPLHRRQRRERGDLEQQEGRERGGRGEERAQAPRQAVPEREQHEQRREREHADVEVELGDVVDEPAQHLCRFVRIVAGDGVRTEQAERRLAAHELGDQRDERGTAERSVEHAKRAPRAEHDRSDDDRREERERLRAGQVRDDATAEQEQLPRGRRPLEREHEDEHDREEDREEDVLGHHLAGVEERRERDGEHGREERQPHRQNPTREEVRREGSERHRDGVDRLDRGVRVRQRVEEQVRRRDHERVDQPVTVCGDPADREAVSRREAARELRVDELVDDDPRGVDAQREEEPRDRRHGDDRRQPRPHGHGSDQRLSR